MHPTVIILLSLILQLVSTTAQGSGMSDIIELSDSEEAGIESSGFSIIGDTPDSDAHLSEFDFIESRLDSDDASSEFSIISIRPHSDISVTEDCKGGKEIESVRCRYPAISKEIQHLPALNHPDKIREDKQPSVNTAVISNLDTIIFSINNVLDSVITVDAANIQLPHIGVAAGDDKRMSYDIWLRSFYSVTRHRSGGYKSTGDGVVLGHNLHINDDAMIGLAYLSGRIDGIADAEESMDTHVGTIYGLIPLEDKVSLAGHISYGRAFAGDTKCNIMNTLVKLFCNKSTNTNVRLTPSISFNYYGLNLKNSGRNLKYHGEGMKTTVGMSLNKTMYLTDFYITPEINYNFTQTVWSKESNNFTYLLRNKRLTGHKLGVELSIGINNRFDTVIGCNYLWTPRYRTASLFGQVRFKF